MRERILLVDAEPNRRRLLSRRLTRQGYEVTTARSVDEALVAESESGDAGPRVVLVDVSLLCGPDRDRLEQLIACSQSIAGDASTPSGEAAVDADPAMARTNHAAP